MFDEDVMINDEIDNVEFISQLRQEYSDDYNDEWQGWEAYVQD